MKVYSWKNTQFSQFNESDTLLLVSGVHFGNHSNTGEIAVFNLEVIFPASFVFVLPYINVYLLIVENFFDYCRKILLFNVECPTSHTIFLGLGTTTIISCPGILDGWLI